METKQCSACKQTLTLNNYSLSGRSVNNYKGVPHKLRYSSRCKPCAAVYSKGWRARNPSYERSRVKGTVVPDDIKLLHSFVRARLCDARARSQKYGKPYNLDFEYALGLYTGYCAISKLPLSLTRRDLDVGSLDCIIPELGYVQGNVQWLTWRVNRAKGEQTQSDFILMCKAVLEGATTIP